MSFYELVDERQRRECDFAQVYAKDFNHGTPTHNHLMLIAKLSSHIIGKEAIANDPEFHLEAAKRAFDAYTQARNGIAFDGSKIPDWENTSPGVREAWIVAAETISTLLVLR